MQACRLAARDLACQRGERALFRRVTLDLASGQALQVTGANGSGKSSMIRLLAGLGRPLAGVIERTGNVALLDENAALDPHVPLGRALDFWAILDGADHRSAVTDRLGLAALLDIPVRYLSTGQRKRAAFTRLMAQGAPIWLLDEPLNGLDKAAAGTIEELVAAHCEAGGIAVIASHQPFTLPGMALLDVESHAA